MKRNQIILIVVTVLFVGLLAAALLLYDDLSDRVDPGTLSGQQPAPEEAPADDTQELSMAPDFTVVDGEGNPVSLSDFLGKPVVVNFWASWCGPCKSEMPAFETAWQTYGDRVQFLMVNLTDNNQETPASAQAFLDSSGYTFPVYFDTQLDGAITYGVVGIPASYFIDAEGRLVAGANTALSYELLETGIGMILEE